MNANWVWLISIKALKGSINLALWSIFQFGHKHWLKSRKVCQSKFADWLKSWKIVPHEWKLSITKNQLKKRWILQEIKLYSSARTIWQLNYTCFRVFGALGQFGETGPKYPNGLGYTESNTKSSTAHLTPNGVVRLISIQAFQLINLILAISFSIWACAFRKK